MPATRDGEGHKAFLDFKTEWFVVVKAILRLNWALRSTFRSYLGTNQKAV